MYKRYERQILLPEIGFEGQEKLRQARILIVGVGGLGCPIALYLTGAGVGTLGLVDDDTVSLSNLQRQVLYTEDELGKRKVACAAKRLKALNDGIIIEEHPYRLDNNNAQELISLYDIVIDGCDNLETRYLISDTCSSLHIPYIYGAITAFGGQVAIFCQHIQAKTYRNLFPDEEKCSGLSLHNGVVGTTPAIVGSVQANEALKLICGYGTPLVDKLWTIDFLNMETNIISL